MLSLNSKQKRKIRKFFTRIITLQFIPIEVGYSPEKEQEIKRKEQIEDILDGS